MSGALLERGSQRGWGGAQTSIEFAQRAPQARTPDLLSPGARAVATYSPGGVLTLDELVASAWCVLQGGRHVACPACGGEMTPGLTGAAEATEAWCGDCGCVLS